MRPPIDNPKTRMKSALESTGAAIVCVQSLVTRLTSRPAREIRPRWRSARSDTRSTLARRLTAALVTLLTVWAATPAAGAFEIIAHRGARGYAPENTIPAFMSALRIGVSAIEVDVLTSRDGRVIVRHDARVSRTLCTGGYAGRYYKNLTFRQVQRLDCGTRHLADRLAGTQHPVPGAHVPALAQLFRLGRPTGVRYLVEI